MLNMKCGLRKTMLLVALTSAPYPAFADRWEKRISDSETDIQVSYRATGGYTEFRAVTHVKSRLSAFVALFRDTDRMPEWVYRTRKAKTLEKISETEVYAYTVSEMQWPLLDRDAIVHTTLSQDPQSLAITIRGRAAPHYRPENKGYVRMKIVESLWSFTPTGPGSVEVVFQGYGDPGGNLSTSIAKWFIDLALWEAPYYTLLGLQKVISRDAYQSATYGFVREPGE